MPKRSQGQNRPADPVAKATRVAEAGSGEIEEEAGDTGKDKAAQVLGRKGGLARRDKLAPEGGNYSESRGGAVGPFGLVRLHIAGKAETVGLNFLPSHDLDGHPPNRWKTLWINRRFAAEV